MTTTKKYYLRFIDADGNQSDFKVKFRTRSGAARWAENALKFKTGHSYEVRG